MQSALVDGVNLEGIGVPPDIEVPFDVRYCAGQDAQIEKALEYLVDQKQNKQALGRENDTRD